MKKVYTEPKMLIQAIDLQTCILEPSKVESNLPNDPGNGNGDDDDDEYGGVKQRGMWSENGLW